MKAKKGFTLIELLVVIAIIALLLSILMPSLQKAKGMARTVICRSNMRQWGLIWSLYLEGNSDKFPWGNFGNKDAGQTVDKGAWIYAVQGYYQADDIRFCPSATKYGSDEERSTRAWQPIDPASWQAESPYYYGSYAINDWVHNPTRNVTDKKLFWGNSLVSGASNIPLMAEGSWWKIKVPRPTDSVLPSRDFDVEDATERGGDDSFKGLGRACVDRHNKYCNVLFMDISAHKVGLKELWYLEWYRKWDIVEPVWPEWMQSF